MLRVLLGRHVLNAIRVDGGVTESYFCLVNQELNDVIAKRV